MRSVLWTILLTSSLAVGMAAQGQQPGSPGQQPELQRPSVPQQPERPQPSSPAAQLSKTTISGCIQSAPAAAPAAGAAPAAAASKFDLANAKIVTAGPVGTSGTSTATRYRLEGDEKTISTHLNHQVEITGTVSPASGTAATAAPMLKVESVKMVAATCPAAAR